MFEDYFQNLINYLKEHSNLTSHTIDQNLLQLIDVSPFAEKHWYFAKLLINTFVTFPFYLALQPLDMYCLLHTVEGQGQLNYKEKTYILNPDSFAFFDCNNYSVLSAQKLKHWHFKALFINGPSLLAYYKLYHQDDYVVCPNISDISLISIVKKIFECYTSITETQEMIASKLITDLLTQLIVSKEKDLDRLNKIPAYILEIKKLFDEKYREQYNLEELAKQYHISKYKLISDFTKFLNHSPINYLILQRISAAKSFLRNTDDTINEIALKVGIENINHFINLFKKSTGVTPMHYRKLCRSNAIQYLEE